MRNLLLLAITTATLSIAACAADGYCAASASSTAQADYSSLIASAVAAPDRPENARALDESRKPAETLAWLGLKPGMDAADFLPGGGYWTEIIARVVGDNGSITAVRPVNFNNTERDYQTWAALQQRAPNVSVSFFQFEHFSYAPSSFDFAIMNLNYHDFYWESEKYNIAKTDPQEFVGALFTAMRPGGIVGIIDHVGLSGNTREIVEKTHRIDPAVVIADFEKEGFELVGQNDLLANPDDDHTINVFDPRIRGKTDRFLLKFRKPAN